MYKETKKFVASLREKVIQSGLLTQCEQYLMEHPEIFTFGVDKDFELANIDINISIVRELGDLKERPLLSITLYSAEEDDIDQCSYTEHITTNNKYWNNGPIESLDE